MKTDRRCVISEFHSVEVELLQDNEASLLRAIEAIGYKPIVHEQPVNLYGYLGDKRTELAHILIPRSQVGGSSNDIGFERLANGKYKMHVSEFDKNRWNAKLPKLMQTYGVGAVLNQTQTSDYSLVEQVVQPDGTIRIRLRINNE